MLGTCLYIFYERFIVFFHFNIYSFQVIFCFMKKSDVLFALDVFRVAAFILTALRK